MTILRYLLEGTSGVTMTTANSGAQQVYVSSGSATFSTLTKQGGATGGRWVTTSANVISRFGANASNANMAFEGVITIPSAVGSEPISLMSLRHTSGPAILLQLTTSS